jgi:hypothetical protein
MKTYPNIEKYPMKSSGKVSAQSNGVIWNYAQ